MNADATALERHDAWCGCLSRTDLFGNVEPCEIARDHFDSLDDEDES